MKLFLQLAVFAALLLPLSAQDEDVKSSALTIKAWKALEADKNAETIAACKQCIKLYEKEALKMQKALKAPVEGTNDEITAKWALNDVGTCYYIMGKALEKQGKDAEAKTSYEMLEKKVSFAQCWDPNGWFWSPADAAKEQLAGLKTKAEKK